jgi:simple sugar transport system substrate-binding protein
MTGFIRRGQSRYWRGPVRFAALALAAGAALAACSSNSSGSASSGSASSASGTGSAAANSSSGGNLVPGGPSLAGKTVLLDIYDPESNTFFQPAVNGAKAAAAEFGLNLQIEYANSDDPTAISQIKTAIASKYAGVVAKIPDTGVMNAACAVKAAGIPVVAFNTITSGGNGCAESFVGQDFVSSGELIAQYMVSQGLIKSGDSVFCPVEAPDQSYAVSRKQGVENVLSAMGIQCNELGTGDDLATAKSDMVQYLLGHRNTKAIIALGGTPLAETQAAASAAGVKIAIGGFDLSFPQIVTGIQSGAIAGSVNQEPYAQGFYSIEEIALQLKFGIQPMNINTSNNALITKANVGSFGSLVPNYQ